MDIFIYVYYADYVTVYTAASKLASKIICFQDKSKESQGVSSRAAIRNFYENK
jgi:hypothetical protein